VRELLEGVRDDGARRHRRRNDGSDAPAFGELAADTAQPRRGHPSASPHRGKIDFGILTIREDENVAVLRRFDKVATDKQQRVYRIRSLKLPSGGAYTLAVLRCLEQGNADAQAAASAMLEDLAPRFLLVVGIAGGAPSHEFSLGDVVVSSRIVDFSVEAVIRSEGHEYALGGGPLHSEAGKLAADLSAMITDDELPGWSCPDSLTKERPPVDLGEAHFYGTDQWQKSVRDKLTRHFADKPPRRPLAVTGAIASSDRLIKDDETLAVWLKFARQVVAVEMESAGIYKATHGRNVPFLAIRGISDVVGFKRHPDWTAYACETAAAFTRAFLLTRPIEPIVRR
jgi:nucleoside phosphorylase